MRIRGTHIQQMVARFDRRLPQPKAEKQKMGKLVELQKHRLETAACTQHWQRLNDEWEGARQDSHEFS